jgi:hypothetical protein
VAGSGRPSQACIDPEQITEIASSHSHEATCLAIASIEHGAIAPLLINRLTLR